MSPIPILIVVGVAVLGIFSHQVIKEQQGVPPPLDFGDASAEKGYSMFDFIAHRYDAINRILAFRMDVGWRKQMVQLILAEVQDVADPKILDVATGTADVALMTASMIPSATIVGVDPSNGMLDVGRRKIQNQQRQDQIQLQWADARDLTSTLEPSSFHAATMAFGIRNVPERNVALCEIYNVLTPEALLTILEFSEPSTTEGAILERAAGVFIQHVVPFVGGILSGQPRMYKHLQNSIKNFPSPVEFEAYVNSLVCTSSTQPSFNVEQVQHLNFGSVQLYSIRSLKPLVEPVPEQVHQQEIPVPGEPVDEEDEAEEPTVEAETVAA
ncbi:Demethylmenaquinone methyltransferase [Seminavis robusta]|uniref:Demethylmenaquinone methyltransferase n=1 Tax=Seminavis robusta TaxID=568900 RepID=A0A9N8HVG3_9STRA|nr:Demethylmenaquinone methyltransferase [Seminavis robusta]|eukprot:Sro2324_g323370.1 Demethylmenaquinone methyltransferase (327) ;mRNA; r:11859-12839